MRAAPLILAVTALIPAAAPAERFELLDAQRHFTVGTSWTYLYSATGNSSGTPFQQNGYGVRRVDRTASISNAPHYVLRETGVGTNVFEWWLRDTGTWFRLGRLFEQDTATNNALAFTHQSTQSNSVGVSHLPQMSFPGGRSLIDSGTTLLQLGNNAYTGSVQVWGTAGQLESVAVPLGVFPAARYTVETVATTSVLNEQTVENYWINPRLGIVRQETFLTDRNANNQVIYTRTTTRALAATSLSLDRTHLDIRVAERLLGRRSIASDWNGDNKTDAADLLLVP